MSYSPTFLKLNRAVRRKTQLGLKLKETELEYTKDYMGVRCAGQKLEIDSTKLMTIELPQINPAREYTAVVIVNPALYELGTVSVPSFFPHTGDSVIPKVTLKPSGKCELDLEWLVEYRLLA